MFSYQHRYHAGSFADVHKHIVLVAILSQLLNKAKPFGVLDLYAGEGLYDLTSMESKKNSEFKHGFKRLEALNTPPSLLKNYLDIIQHYHPFYPGSPAIATHFLRKEDSIICNEGHPQAVANLRQHFKHHPQLHIHQRDAFEAIQGLLPLKEKRGLVFIDPSYEVKNEFKEIANALIEAFNRFKQGIYAIWYPLLSSNQHYVLLNALQASALTKIWYCEWIPFAKNEDKNLHGSGICIANMPWQMDLLLNETFAWLNKQVYKGGLFKHGWF
ncbi:MAG: 23S rRNA (adenine(2030)-N(6))-methyltransferase RlmJ [Proteobacteria bacterium]|nr:23S rRNA (adenine(2030)-N(6))-methyltransferase RlmJ [Pseudomonadota bacterium]